MRLAVSSLCALLAALVPARAQGDAWWSYRPLARPPVPAVDDAFIANDIDRFVLARLQQRGLAPSPAASPEVLIRRLTYDLTGLPPSPEQVAAFVADPSPATYDALVERLLASPHYGEKWGRHWLDLARYAETNSFERDGKKPAAWRYRDWVVGAFNRDLPYGDFVQQQLAGDELAGATIDTVTATGFLRLGLWDDEPTDALAAIYDDLDNVADTTARAMLGMSMGCARCHDHKKDPITARDYYSFLAFFEHLRPYRPASGTGGALSPENYTRALPAVGAADAHAAALGQWERQRAALADEARARASESQATEGTSTDGAAAAADTAGLVAGYRGELVDAHELPEDRGGPAGRIEGQVVAVPGRLGSAMRFDGDDRIVLPLLVRDAFTIAFWVRSSAPGRGQAGDPRWFLGNGLVDGEVPGITSDFGISWLGDGVIAAGTGAPETFVSSAPGHADGEWHHVAFTRDRSTGRIALFVDGAQADAQDGGKERLDAPPRLVVGGLQPGGRGFAGDLDELRFYDRALPPAEVAALALALPASSAQRPGLGDDDGALARLAALPRPRLPTHVVLCARERSGEPEPSFVRIRGDVHSKGERVEPAFPAVLGVAAPRIERPAGGEGSGRRTALARWIRSETNPLTWRVAANRLWQHHFGRGLCRSSSDFGRLGELPTHPELLDWLACELVARGGSLKAMHRLIVTSSTYRMACAVDAQQAAIDPQNELLWRFDRRRLLAEELRDSMLAAAGVLDLRLGGESVYPPLPQAVLATASRPDEAWDESSPQDSARRSLYIHQKRSLQEPLLAAFDLADPDASCPGRFSTVQPTQALMLLNGEFAQATARQFAERLLRECDTPRARLERGLWLTTCRVPVAAEVERMLAMYERLRREHGRNEAMALQRCCLVLLNQNEFAYLD